MGKSQHFRNVERHEVTTDKHLLVIRVDESLYFANTRFVEDFIRTQCSRHREVQHVILLCNAVNFIDASALESLENLTAQLASQEITLHLAEVKGPVMDQLHNTHCLQQLGPGQVFFTADEAMQALGDRSTERPAI